MQFCLSRAGGHNKNVWVHVLLCISMCGCISLSVQCVKCSPYSHVAEGCCGWWWWWLYQVYAWSCLGNLTQRKTHCHNNTTPFTFPPPPTRPPSNHLSFFLYPACNKWHFSLSPTLPTHPLTAITALTDGDWREGVRGRENERGEDRGRIRGGETKRQTRRGHRVRATVISKKKEKKRNRQWKKKKTWWQWWVVRCNIQGTDRKTWRNWEKKRNWGKKEHFIHPCLVFPLISSTAILSVTVYPTRRYTSQFTGGEAKAWIWSLCLTNFKLQYFT